MWSAKVTCTNQIYYISTTANTMATKLSKVVLYNEELLW